MGYLRYLCKKWFQGHTAKRVGENVEGRAPYRWGECALVHRYTMTKHPGEEWAGPAVKCALSSGTTCAASDAQSRT